MHEADGRDHVEIGAGQRAVGQPQAAVLAVDGAAVERERCHVGADRRHRVGDQENLGRAALGAQRDGDGRRIDMDAVGDQPGRQRPVSIAAPASPGSRLPIWLIALNRCVTMVAPASAAAAGEAVARVGMAEADDDAGPGERLDARGSTVSGATVVSSTGSRCARRDQRRLVGIVHRADQRRIMRALARHRQMRAFEMQAEEARHLSPRRLDAGRDGRRSVTSACR